MNNSVTNASDHEEIVSLLPWFVNNTLEEQQQEDVLKHIKHCDDCRQEIKFLESLQETVKDDALSSYSKHANIDNNLSSVMSQIDAESGSRLNVSSFVSVLQNRLKDLLLFLTALSLPQLGATALAGVLVAVVGIQLFERQSDNDYTVLSSPDITDASMRLLVDPHSTDNYQQLQSNIQDEFIRNGHQVEIEKNDNGQYVVVFKEPIGVAELSDLIAKLDNTSFIERVQILP